MEPGEVYSLEVFRVVTEPSARSAVVDVGQAEALSGVFLSPFEDLTIITERRGMLTSNICSRVTLVSDRVIHLSRYSSCIMAVMEGSKST